MAFEPLRQLVALPKTKIKVPNLCIPFLHSVSIEIGVVNCTIMLGQCHIIPFLSRDPFCQEIEIEHQIVGAVLEKISLIDIYVLKLSHSDRILYH